MAYSARIMAVAGSIRVIAVALMLISPVSYRGLVSQQVPIRAHFHNVAYDPLASLSGHLAELLPSDDNVFFHAVSSVFGGECGGGLLWDTVSDSKSFCKSFLESF